MNTGQQLVKFLKPGGCALVLILSALMMIVCFTSGKDPVQGYSAPHDSEYYAGRPAELKAELEQNVFPELSGVESCSVTQEGKLLITLSGNDFAVARSAILHYYDSSLFEFVNSSND